MYASWVRGENPRTVMSRIMRVRSSLMSHLRQKIWDGGDCEPGSGATPGLEGADDSAALTRARAEHYERDRPYRVIGLVPRTIDREREHTASSFFVAPGSSLTTPARKST